MPDATTLAVFTGAALALLVVPGPAVLYIVTQSIDRGRRAGLVSMLGIQTGGLVHVAAATVGLSSLLASSATAFSVVKYAGAAYLVVLGVQRLLEQDEPASASPRAPRRLSRLYLRGVLVNVLNPKTALFFFAFLPQFVDPDKAAAPQILLLGLLFIALAVLSDGAYAVLAGSLGTRIRRSRALRRAQRYVSASVFVGLGLATAAARRSP